MRALSVRAKLTLLYVAVTIAGLFVFGILSEAALQYSLMRVKKDSIRWREDRLMRYLRESRANQVPLDELLHDYSVIAHEGNLLEMRSPQGALVYPTQPPQEDWTATSPRSCRHEIYTPGTADGQAILVRCHLIVVEGRPVELYIGSALDDNESVLDNYRYALLLLLPCLLALSAFSGYFLSRHALRPVSQMTSAALGMGIANLSARLPVPSAKDELRDLALAWNQLLRRLEEAVSRLTEFSADVSHDLRTSITVILATAELSLHRHRSEEEYRADLERIVTECRTAATLLDALLSIARSDTFVHELSFRKIQLGELVVASCKRVEELADHSGIILDWRLPLEEIAIEGDELLLQRLLGILLDNALKFTPEAGEVTVSLFRAEDEAVVEVRDSGVGMSEEMLGRIFDRFYQGDLRERKTEAGSGLGLSIAKWIADAHRARLTVASKPMRGSVFQISFPLAVMAPVSRPRVEAAV